LTLPIAHGNVRFGQIAEMVIYHLSGFYAPREALESETGRQKNSTSKKVDRGVSGQSVKWIKA
jgi:hypothetical protein